MRVYSKALVEENRKIVEGKIESRGVEQVYPVGGEPGARVQIALTQPQGSGSSRFGKGLKASYWLRRMGSTPPRDSYFLSP